MDESYQIVCGGIVLLDSSHCVAHKKHSSGQIRLHSTVSGEDIRAACCVPEGATDAPGLGCGAVMLAEAANCSEPATYVVPSCSFSSRDRISCSSGHPMLSNSRLR